MNKLSENINYELFKQQCYKITQYCNNSKVLKDSYLNAVEKASIKFYSNEYGLNNISNIIKETIRIIQGGSSADSKMEEIFMSLLDKNNFKYEFQKKEGKYRIDFLIGKIALELDGPRHWQNYEQSKHDKIKDQYLENKGYIVLRIRSYVLVMDTERVIRILKCLNKKYNTMNLNH